MAFMLFGSLSTYAYEFEVDGIYYNTDFNNAIVTRGDYDTYYSGDITIPATVSHNGVTYTVTSIGEKAFMWCTELTRVDIPNTVTLIDSYAFCYCRQLTSMVISQNVTTINTWAFDGCWELSSITVESGNPRYDSRDNCNAIIESSTNTLIAGCKNTIIPNSVTKIGFHAFNGCSGLTSISIPNSVTSIETAAFASCMNLASVDIPNSVTYIGESAFNFCNALESVIIPNSVTTIDHRAFYGCSRLTKVSIGNSITTIGGSAFCYCNRLSKVLIYATTIPNTYESAFDESNYNNSTLYVAVGCKDAYAMVEPWSGFGQIVEMIPGDVDEDGKLNISDITSLIDSLLNGNEASVNADVDEDGKVSISDITSLIDLLLNGGISHL